jgi:ParB family chromosome partitioning protein
VQGAISRGRISEGHGRALLAIADRDAILAAWKIVEDKGLSVRETEELTKTAGGVVSRETRTRQSPQNPELADLARQLGERYSTTAAITRSGKGGLIKLSYYSEVDLERLIDMLTRP